MELYNDNTTADGKECCLHPCSKYNYEFKEYSNDRRDGNYNTAQSSTILSSTIFLKMKNKFIRVYRQQYSYDFAEMLGEIGGTWGLFLGASFLTLFEAIHKMYDSKCFCGKKRDTDALRF
jgi:hypothetical protein